MVSRNKNKYQKFSKIGEAKFRQLVNCFAQDINVTETASLIGLSKRSTNRIFLKMRNRIEEYCQSRFPFEGGVEICETFFESKPVRGSSTVVFGVFEHEGEVFTEIVSAGSEDGLREVVLGRASAETVVRSDGWRGYNALVDMKSQRLLQFNGDYHDSSVVPGRENLIELFWSAGRRRLKKFNGVPKHTFCLHLKETEFRFNHRGDNLYKMLLRMLRENPI